METKEFLKQFHGDDKINFRVIKDNCSNNLNGTYEELESQLYKLNEEGCNIYFVVNSGGTHIQDINRINAVFIDFDCGRDKNKQYYPLEITEKFKNECMEKVEKFKCQPSFIIETRNGIHVYWLVNNNTTNEQYLECQLRLIKHFNSDSAIKDLTRIMRVPGFYWTKDINNKFMCKVIKYNNIRYEIGDIMKELPIIEEEKNSIIANKQNINTIIKIKPKKNNIELIKNKDIKGLQGVLFGINDEGRKVPTIDKTNNLILSLALKPQIIVTNRSELYDTINKINLVEFLGLNSSRFNCIFHDDNTYSASIFINSETGHYLYKCHSGDCKFPSGTIIRVVERLQKCSKPQAINFIKSVYGIKLIETEWQKEQKEILQANKDYLYSGLMADEFPQLYKRIRNYIPILIMINDIAMNNVYDESISDSDKVIFFASIRYIANALNTKDIKRLTERLNLFVFLELIEKLSVEDIPEHMLKEAKHQAALKKQNKLVSYYSIPSYNDSLLEQAQNNAILFEDKNMTMKGWSRELLIRNFGEDSDIVNRVYPQYKGKKLTKSSEEFAETFDMLIVGIIEYKGYATEKEIIKMLEGYKEFNKVKIKRVLQETIEKHNLKRIRCNGEIKKQYNMDTNGYPFIIVKN